jgi:putative iron-regulated protein
MKNSLYAIACVSLLTFAGCKKSNNNVTTTGPTETQVLTDFSNDLANPNYQDIQAKAGVMNVAIDSLVVNTNTTNLNAARTAWVNTRRAWESCEGYLFGPVEDDNYDPDTDSWPVDAVELDSLLSSSNALTVGDISALPQTLKGYHAIEYIIFGEGSTAKASDITARQKQFLSSLAQSIYNTTTNLRNSWDPLQGDFTAQVIGAGTSASTYFATKQAAFLTIVGSMSDICDEVANSKMQTPFAARDSTLDESSFSHNSIIDFTNNITGIQNAYFSRYNNAGGHSLHELVAAKNASLDATLQSQMQAAISSFGIITTTFEKAIYTQRNQVASVQNTINTLKATLDGQLTTFVKTNIKD